MQTPRDLAESLVRARPADRGRGAVPDVDSRLEFDASSRLLTPWKFVPSVGSVKIVNVTPGNAEVLVGDSVEIAAEIENPDAKPHRGLAVCRGRRRARIEAADVRRQEAPATTRPTVPSVLKSFRYRLEIGDSQTERYSIGVREKPVVESAEVTFRYPAYLGRKDETVRQTSLDIEAPQYTRGGAAFAGFARRWPGVSGDGTRAFLRPRRRRKAESLTADCPLLTERHVSRAAVQRRRATPIATRGKTALRCFRDAPPTVELLKPARQTTAAPGAKIVVVIRAGDDHGLGRLQLEMKTVLPSPPRRRPKRTAHRRPTATP